MKEELLNKAAAGVKRNFMSQHFARYYNKYCALFGYIEPRKFLALVQEKANVKSNVVEMSDYREVHPSMPINQFVNLTRKKQLNRLRTDSRKRA